MKKGVLLLALVFVLLLTGCTGKKEDPNALTDEEWANVQAVFSEKIGEEIEYKPVYCGEWREGKQYKTQNYAYGQFLINMDTDGYVHLVVWIENGDRTVMYNRLDEE